MRALGSEEQRATDHHLLGALIEAPSDRVVRFVGAGGMESTWQERAQLARRVAGQLRRHGIQRGEAVGLLLTNGPSCVNALVGTWAAGATVMSLPLPSRTQDRPQYAETIARLCDTAGATTVIVERAVSSLLEDVDRERFRVLVADELSDGAPVDPDPLDAGEVAFIQCSSGSTGNARGCALTFAALSRQLDLLDGMVEMDPRSDIVVSWLPLSHDMGLIGGLLLQWSRGTRLVLGSPERFLSAPRTWMGDCADAGATITVGPSAALRLAARHARRRTPERPFPMRACISGGERVGWDTLLDVDRTLGPFGMTLDVLKPAYGLAEAALAVTATPLRRAPRALPVDAAALMRREVVPMTEEDSTAMLTSAGPPLPGVDVRIDGGDTVGEILVRSPSNAVGYVGDPERTAEGFRDGWIHTGDVGFFWEGELHIAGRLDDVIQVAGANLNVAAIEHRVALHPALRIGGCALVDLPTRDGEVALVAELRDPEQGELGTLAGELARHVTEQAAVRPRRFVFLDRGALPKTPSGKLQRFRCRELALDSSGVPGHVGTVDLDRRGSAAGIEVAA